MLVAHPIRVAPIQLFLSTQQHVVDGHLDGHMKGETEFIDTVQGTGTGTGNGSGGYVRASEGHPYTIGNRSGGLPIRASPWVFHMPVHPYTTYEIE